MKKYLLGAFALVLAVGFSAFTNYEAPREDKQPFVRYLVWDNTNPQNQFASYTQTSVLPSCPGSIVLCAIRFEDNNGTVTQAEFNTTFAALDADDNGSLNNDTESINLLKKS